MRYCYPKYLLHRTVWLLLLVLVLPAGARGAAHPFPRLFGYNEWAQTELGDLPQWLKVIERHTRYDFIKKDEKLAAWFSFLDSIRTLPAREQVRQVNRFANDSKYIIDLNNYGVEDYWAIVKEFLHNSGDCEDYSITKFFSLRLLGFSREQLRLVILQDTNLQVAHAVLAVAMGNDVLILDNQAKEVISHRSIVHYTPLYSVNEQQWWLHLPPEEILQ